MRKTFIEYISGDLIVDLLFILDLLFIFFLGPILFMYVAGTGYLTGAFWSCVIAFVVTITIDTVKRRKYNKTMRQALEMLDRISEEDAKWLLDKHKVDYSFSNANYKEILRKFIKGENS